MSFLSEHYETSPSFCRSRNILADYNSEDFINEYVWGHTTLSLQKHFFSSFLTKNDLSAFSLTGPYGTGKSAFVISILQLLGSAGKEIQERAIASLEAHSDSHSSHSQIELSKQCALPIILTGEKKSLDESILLGIKDATHKLITKAEEPEPLRKFLQYRAQERKLNSNTTDIVSLFKEFLKVVSEYKEQGKKRAKFSNCILVIDEFGKYLEHAVRSKVNATTEVSDIHTLQLLSELRGSELSLKTGVIVILHQEFHRYAENLDLISRNEFEKIQGRLEPLLLSPLPEENIELIIRSIKKKEPVNTTKLDAWTKKVVSSSESLPCVPKKWNKKNVSEWTIKALPFNLVSLFVLPELSRSLGQNARSTFTFLSSPEPKGFKAFLQSNELETNKLLGLDYLYDYFCLNNIGIKGVNSRILAEIAVVLDAVQGVRSKISDKELAAQIIKIIGILTLLNSPGKFPRQLDVIQKSIGNTEIEEKAIVGILKELTQNNHLIFRKSQKEYHLWQGSDFDIDQAIQNFREMHFKESGALKFLSNQLHLLPIVPQRHYEETGNLRHFKVQLIGHEELLKLSGDNDIPFEDKYDGVIFLCVPLNRDQYQEMKDKLSFKHSNFLFWILPAPSTQLVEALVQQMGLTYLLQHETAVKGEAMLQKEIKERLYYYERQVKDIIFATFWSFKGTTIVFHSGESNDQIKQLRNFNAYLSDKSNLIYNKAPSLKNELINRREISSTIRTAINKLIEAAIVDPTKEDLGLVGNPPEKTIYRSLLKASGIHVSAKDSAIWLFPPLPQPQGRQNKTWKVFWSGLQATFEGLNGREVSALDLIQTYTQPPYGLREPVILLNIVFYFLANSKTLTIYNNRTYLPTPSLQDLQLLIKRPKFFSFRALAPKAGDINFLEGFWLGLNKKKVKESVSSIHLDYEIGSQIYDWHGKLTPFCKQTRLYCDNRHIELKICIERSNKLDELIFVSIPKALNLDATKKNREVGYEVGKALLAAMDEITNIKTKLLEDNFNILNSIIFESDLGKNRKDFQKRVLDMVHRIDMDRVKNIQVQSFINRAKEHFATFELWLEAVVGAIGLKPLDKWNDSDVRLFKDKAKDVGQSFSDLYHIYTEMPSIGQDYQRITLTDVTGTSKAKVLPVRSKQHEPHIQQLLKNLPSELSKDDKLAVLSEALYQLMGKKA